MSRELAIEKLSEYISERDICERIEKSIYEYTLQTSEERGITPDMENNHFRLIYVNKLHQIYTNMNPDSYVKNMYFIDRILTEEINPDKIAFLTPQELHYEHWKEILKKQDAAEKLASSISAGTRTNEYTCSRCRGNDCTFINIQLRSADEPVSTIIQCSCGKKWRIG
jgi:DNA-directed RNA polymerase subunit M/transcription elongation factor TFIIS